MRRESARRNATTRGALPFNPRFAHSLEWCGSARHSATDFAWALMEDARFGSKAPGYHDARRPAGPEALAAHCVARSTVRPPLMIDGLMQQSEKYGSNIRNTFDALTSN